MDKYVITLNKVHEAHEAKLNRKVTATEVAKGAGVTVATASKYIKDVHELPAKPTTIARLARFYGYNECDPEVSVCILEDESDSEEPEALAPGQRKTPVPEVA